MTKKMRFRSPGKMRFRRATTRALHGRLLAVARTDTYMGREHLVVPVVALVEGVVQAANADVPELVTAAELAKTVAGWNGRPLVLDHPASGPHRISANDPRVRERHEIGTLFGMRVEGKKLTGEAWVDLERAQRVAGGAEMVARLRDATDIVEVSVGAFVQTLTREGTHDGKRYAAVWSGITPDHLALLPKGAVGACSVAAGCGVRAAEQVTVCGPSAAEGGSMTTKRAAGCACGGDAKEGEVPAPQTLTEAFGLPAEFPAEHAARLAQVVKTATAFTRWMERERLGRFDAPPAPRAASRADEVPPPPSLVEAFGTKR